MNAPWLRADVRPEMGRLAPSLRAPGADRASQAATGYPRRELVRLLSRFRGLAGLRSLLYREEIAMRSALVLVVLLVSSCSGMTTSTSTSGMGWVVMVIAGPTSAEGDGAG